MTCPVLERWVALVSILCQSKTFTTTNQVGEEEFFLTFRLFLSDQQSKNIKFRVNCYRLCDTEFSFYCSRDRRTCISNEYSMRLLFLANVTVPLVGSIRAIRSCQSHWQIELGTHERTSRCNESRENGYPC